MIYENLTAEDIQKIEKYIELYASTDSEEEELERINKPMAPLNHILRFWDAEKEWLYNAFGNTFAYEWEYFYKADREEIKKNLRDTFWYSSNVNNIRNENLVEEAYRFYCACKKIVKDNNEYPADFYCSVFDNFNAMADNKYTGPNAKIMNNAYTTGMKITKVFAKIAKAHNIDGFESFRLVHSQILNESKLGGTMCLSIHPLDYMTMSDSRGWSSCMSWTQAGCYRQGTVEMMNSPYVVVAYLKASDLMYYDNEIEWNNKKWRQLFIVTPDIITGIKSYPYYNENLTNACMDKLKELLSSVYTYSDEKIMFDYHGYNSFEVSFNGVQKKFEDIEIEFQTCKMYNDIYHALSEGLVYVGENIESKTINYSGESECMWCGQVDDWIYESGVLCDCCFERSYRHSCEECGWASRYEDDFYWVDDTCLCESCFNDLAIETVEYNEYHLRERCFDIVVIDGNNSFRLLDEYGNIAKFYVDFSHDRIFDWFKNFKALIWSDAEFFRPYRSYNNTIYVEKDSPKYKEFLNKFYLEEGTDSVDISILKDVPNTFFVKTFGEN